MFLTFPLQKLTSSLDRRDLKTELGCFSDQTHQLEVRLSLPNLIPDHSDKIGRFGQVFGTSDPDESAVKCSYRTAITRTMIPSERLSFFSATAAPPLSELAPACRGCSGGSEHFAVRIPPQGAGISGTAAVPRSLSANRPQEANCYFNRF